MNRDVTARTGTPTLSRKAQPFALNEMTEEEQDALRVMNDPAMVVTVPIGQIWSLNSTIDALTEVIKDLERQIGLLNQLQRLAGTRALKLGETVASLMGFKDAVCTPPTLDETGVTSIVTLVLDGKALLDVMVPINDPNQEFVLKDHTNDGPDGIRRLCTGTHGELTPDTILTIRGYASILRETLSEPTRTLSAMMHQTNQILDLTVPTERRMMTSYGPTADAATEVIMTGNNARNAATDS
jgi:hypothetical protein